MNRQDMKETKMAYKHKERLIFISKHCKLI